MAEEVGLLKDSPDLEFAGAAEPIDLRAQLDVIHDAVFRCRDITRKLLTFVRQTEVKLEPHHIHRILDDVLDGILANELSISNVKVIKAYDDHIHEFVTDRNQLVQVFVNVVKNAIDAMAQGGELRVRTQHQGDRMMIVFRDTGCGMTSEQLGRVFMPFFTTKEPGKGTGLGLSVSSSIIKNLGGRMYAESALGQGSAFTVELPYETEKLIEVLLGAYRALLTRKHQGDTERLARIQGVAATGGPLSTLRMLAAIDRGEY
ncbi:MAG: ATP-binding protein [Planctomycetota bacterium]